MLFTAEPVREVSERLEGGILELPRGGPVCCGLIPDLELALHPELYWQPVVVARFGDRVMIASEEAAAHGVLAGMTLRQAEALSPTVAVVEPQPEAACRSPASLPAS